MDKRQGICAILMLKDENRYILHSNNVKPQYTMLEQNIRRLKQIVEEVYIVDNGSTDESREIYEKYRDDPICFIQYNDSKLLFDDVRDRKILTEVAKRRNMRWILVVDGDEIYEERATEWIHDFCSTRNHEDHHFVKFHYINFWRGRTHYRTDKWYSSWFPRLFSVKDLELVGEALHNYRFCYKIGNSIFSGTETRANVKCLHYGWADWEHRVHKTHRYISRDMQLTGISYQEAKMKYAQDIDENGIIVAQADPAWGEEFRSGKIDY